MINTLKAAMIALNALNASLTKQYELVIIGRRPDKDIMDKSFNVLRKIHNFLKIAGLDHDERDERYDKVSAEFTRIAKLFITIRDFNKGNKQPVIPVTNGRIITSRKAMKHIHKGLNAVKKDI